MTYPIRTVPDGDTAWGGDVRSAFTAINGFMVVHAVGNSGATLTLNPTVTGNTKTITLTANCVISLAGAAVETVGLPEDPVVMVPWHLL